MASAPLAAARETLHPSCNCPPPDGCDRVAVLDPQAPARFAGDLVSSPPWIPDQRVEQYGAAQIAKAAHDLALGFRHLRRA